MTEKLMQKNTGTNLDIIMMNIEDIEEYDQNPRKNNNAVEIVAKSIVDAGFNHQDKQTSILLHSTPFRSMPATPLACKPMSYKNYRGQIAKTLGPKLKGNIFYQGNAMWAVESMATESLATVAQSAIVWRGTELDGDNFLRIAQSKRFSTAASAVKQATLEKYFDMDRLFGACVPKDLTTKYLRTYCAVEKRW